MKILALDASTEACTVALQIDGNVIERFSLGGNHSERILPMVHEVLGEGGTSLKQLDAIAFGRGPGSFTGLRIAAGVTQGLAFGANLPVVPVSSLAALAQGADAEKVLAAFDARMQQVYWGAYLRNSEGIVALAGAEVVIAPDAVPLPETVGWVGVGSGWDQYADTLSRRLGERVTRWERQVYPSARFVAALGAVMFTSGKVVPAEEALPIYIRDEVAVKAK